MSYFSRRGVAALVVASALVFAPLASVTAYADEAPFVEAPIAETPIATEPVVEEPVIDEPAVEEPIADSPVVAEQTPADEAPADEAPAVEVPAEDAPVDDTSSERERSSLVVPTPLALAPQCDLTAFDQGLTLCLVYDGSTVTMSISRTANGDIGGYHFSIEDFWADDHAWDSGWPRTQANSTPAITLTPGHEYYAYADDSINSVRTFFTIPVAGPEDDCDYTSVDPGYDLAYPFCVDEADDGTSATVYWEALNPGYSTWLDIYDTTTAPWTQVHGAWDSTSPTTFSTTPGHQYRLMLNTQGGGPSWWGELFYTASPLTPAAPTALTATRPGTASSIDLAWEPSVARATNPVVSYTVEVTNASTGITTSTSTTTTSLTATSLTIDEEYTFSVTAVAQGGQRSDAVSTTMTMEVVAPTAAADVVLSRSGETLSASWTAPGYDGGSGAVHYWIVLYADGQYAGQYHQDARSLTFTQLAQFGVEYTAVVVAYNDAGDAPAFTSNPVTRADSLPGTPVAYASVNGFKEPLVYVTWDLAAPVGSDIESIGVTLYDALGAVVDHVDLDPGYTGHNFRNLTNDTAYTVGVVVSNGAGPSTESTRAPATTLGLVPPAYTAEELAADPNYSGVSVTLAGTTLTAHMNGIGAGEWVYGYAHSTPTGLGWTQVDAAGNASWSIAGAGLAAGTHTLAIVYSFGDHLGTAKFTIAAAVPAALAHAGTDPSGLTAIALAMLAFGVIVTIRKSRRRTHA